MAKVLTGEQTHVSRDLGNPTPYHPPSLFSHTPPLALIVAIIMGHSQVSSIYKTLDRRLSCTKLPLFSGVVAKLGGEPRTLLSSSPGQHYGPACLDILEDPDAVIVNWVFETA